MNTTTIAMGRPGPLSGRSPFDWVFAALILVGAGYAWQRYGAAMDVYEKSILVGSVPALVAHYAPDARFKDPFNEVSGQLAIARIFQHMFEAVDEPRFQVLEAIAQGEQAFLTWDFHSRSRSTGKPLSIHGATHLRFDAQGRITQWDSHGYGCAVCLDVARDSMQMFNSGASVASIRAAIDRKYAGAGPPTATVPDPPSVAPKMPAAPAAPAKAKPVKS